jgi:hypothetical protein
VERDKGDFVVLPAKALQMQVYDIVKCADPTTRIRVCDGDDRKAMNGEGACVVSGRVGRIRKRLLPQFEVGFRSVESDASEEVFSCPMNPRFGDDATCFEGRRFVA